ncbi:MAG: hypothetical protein LBD65_04660 [Spirochaetaceae bacterium]|jgi:hypothetical protein|nr:hypothetical protein [Spirochaetaceae bacterium]
MRYFVCTFDHFALGIPEDSAASVIIHSERVTGTVNRYEGGDVFFSLPHFFALSGLTARHGIVLKPLNHGDSPEPEEGRQVLLVNSVDREADILPGDIYPLPELFLASGKFPFFTGISFDGPVMIVFIDPALLIARMLQDAERESA